MRAVLGDRPEIEYLDGVAHPKMSPKTRHAFAQAALVRILADCGGSRGFAGTEWRFRLKPGTKGTLFVPDVAFISAERLRAVPPSERDDPTLAPDVAVEVRSRGGSLRYLQRKIQTYLRYGALAVLDVDPSDRSIVVHTQQGERRFEHGEAVEIAAVPWLRFDVSQVFAQMEAFERL